MYGGVLKYLRFLAYDHQNKSTNYQKYLGVFKASRTMSQSDHQYQKLFLSSEAQGAITGEKKLNICPQLRVSVYTSK
jgi:hypothetical protein